MFVRIRSITRIVHDVRRSITNPFAALCTAYKGFVDRSRRCTNYQIIGVRCELSILLVDGTRVGGILGRLQRFDNDTHEAGTVPRRYGSYLQD